jgi:hypothetical protein
MADAFNGWGWESMMGCRRGRTEGGGGRIRTRGQGCGLTRYYLEQDKRKEGQGWSKGAGANG